MHTRPTLSLRQAQVAMLAAQGLRNKDIADRMGLAEPTVKLFLKHVFAKLGVASRLQLAIAWNGFRAGA